MVLKSPILRAFLYDKKKAYFADDIDRRTFH